MLSTDWRLAILAHPARARRQSRRDLLRPRASTTRFERIQEMFSDISSRVQENLSGVRMIRAFVQESGRTAPL